MRWRTKDRIKKKKETKRKKYVGCDFCSFCCSFVFCFEGGFVLIGIGVKPYRPHPPHPIIMEANHTPKNYVLLFISFFWVISIKPAAPPHSVPAAPPIRRDRVTSKGTHT